MKELGFVRANAAPEIHEQTENELKQFHSHILSKDKNKIEGKVSIRAIQTSLASLSGIVKSDYPNLAVKFCKLAKNRK